MIGITAEFTPSEAGMVKLAAVKTAMTVEEFVKWSAMLHSASVMRVPQEDTKTIEDPWGTGKEAV